MTTYSPITTAERQYGELLESLVSKQESLLRDTRNAKTVSQFGATLRANDIHSHFPLLSSKRVYWKGIVEELLWFLRGDTDATHLQDKNVHIWDGNSSRSFLDSRGLTHYRENDCGPIYGFQWRHFNAPYFGPDADYTGQGVDQLGECMRLIREDPTSRRMVMSGWNPSQLREMCLPPCHVMYQFYVSWDENHQKRLSCMMTQRSGDLFLGVPFNIASTALLTTLVAHSTGCIPKDIILTIGDAHIYSDHISSATEQVQRIQTLGSVDPHSLPPPPTVRIRGSPKEKIEDYTAEDIELLDYHPMPTIKATMVA